MSQLKVPIAFIIFNRPELTQKVFNTIRQVKPSHLFVIADGPRRDRPDDVEKCAAARKVIDSVDWKCEVIKNYSSTNLGCNNRVSSGLDWVFNQVEKIIILEDDCVPHLTFFEFCSQLLDKYYNDERIMAISGNNFQLGHSRTKYSYYFSRYNHCWGWATWRRAWQKYDINMQLWPEIRDSGWLKDILDNPHEIRYNNRIFQATYNNKIDSWAYRWTFACWVQNGLTILPNINLVSNIGFAVDATHTKNPISPFANMPVEKMNFPLQHPPFIIRDNQADKFTYKNKYSFWTRVKNRIINLISV